MNFNFQNHTRSRRLISTILAALLLALFSLTIKVTAQSGDTFPGEPFNGLQIEYSVSGADLGPPEDEQGFTWSRKHDGSLTGRKLVVSGVAHASSGWGATLMVRLSADGTKPVEYTASKFPEHGLFPSGSPPDPMEQPFSVSIDIPSGAENASFSISLTGDFNAGTRAVIVNGNLVGGRSLAGETNPSGGIPSIVIVILAGGAVVIAGGAAIAGGVIIAKTTSAALKKPAKVSELVRDPEVTKTVEAWERAAQQADLEAEKYARQWESVRGSGNPNDPAYQALQKQYQDYIQHQRRQAAEARRQAQEIDALEQQQQQEVRQQQAYHQHRQAESDFIERESQRQARRQGAFDRQIDQMGRDQQQKLEQLKAEREAYRDNLRKELIEARKAVDSAEANQHIAAGVIPGVLESTAEWTQWVADKAIDVIAQVAPGTKPVKIAYLGLRGAAQGAGEAWADKKNWKSHIAMGLKKGTVDAVVYVVKDKPLNMLPTFRGYVKPKWVNLPPGTNVLSVKGSEWLKGVGQVLISKARGRVNPIVHGGKYLKGIKF